MLRKHKQFLLGFLIGSLLFSSITVFADIAEVKVFLSEIKIALNGQVLELKDANGNTVKPIVYNGTTYLPVRALVNAFEKEVNFNGTTNTVEITDKVTEKTPEPKPIVETPKEPAKEENEDTILKVSETFEDNGFKLTLKKVSKEEGKLIFLFYYENNTNNAIHNYNGLLINLDYPKYINNGGDFQFADTGKHITGSYPTYTKVGFPPNSKGEVFAKVMYIPGLDFIKLWDANVGWKFR